MAKRGRSAWVLASCAVVSVMAGLAHGQVALVTNHPVPADVFAEAGFVVDELAYPLMDLRAVREADARDMALGEIPRFAVPNDVQVTPLDAGSVQDLGNGRVAWRLRLTCENAVNMNIGSLWNVPDSVRMYLLDKDGFTPYGAFTSADNHDHGQLWTPIVAGSVMELFVELDERDWDAFAAGFTITRVSTGYRHFGEALMDGLAAREQGADRPEEDDDRSAACHVDVACNDAYPWCLQVKGAAAYTLNGFGTCSGGMLNNVRENRDPIFMSANHCGIHNNPASAVIYWNYQNATCREPGSSASAGAGTCGNIPPGANCNSTTSSGASLIATYQPADWTLVRLSTTPPDSFKVVYLGWDRRSPGVATPSAGFGIHHPGVQEKRISSENNPFATQTISIGGPNISCWRVQYDAGGIEQGSSGSPLFNQAGRVVGTATAVDTLTACFPQFTWYGRLDLAWTNTPAIRTALDPDNTGAETLDLKQFFPDAAPDTFGFEIAYPKNGTVNVPRNGAVSWNGSCNADTFRVIVSQNANLSSPILDQVVPASQTSLVLPTNLLQYSQVYYWGVQATNTLGTVSSLPVAAQFTVAPQPLGNFTLVSPANGALPTGTGGLFQWTTSSGALGYRLEIDDDPGFGSPYTQTVSAPATQALVPSNALQNATTYSWRVIALKAPDELASATWTFTTQSVPRVCPGDVNRDGFTNAADFTILAGSFGQAVTIGSNGDLNDDAFVNASDFTVLAGDFGCQE